MDIPIYLICYNNYKYVKNMILKLQRYTDNINIIDNKSSDEDTIKYLRECEYKVHYMDVNYGHTVFLKNKSFYNSLPKFFAVSDPDLELNDKMPYNFLEVLRDATVKYNVFKAGLALDISDFDKMHQDIYDGGKNIKQRHLPYWKKRLQDDKYEIYSAPIDTTFAVYNKSNIRRGFYTAVRYAGDFTAKHIPWYVDNWIYSKEELLKSVYNNHNVKSAMKNIITKNNSVLTFDVIS